MEIRKGYVIKSMLVTVLMIGCFLMINHHMVSAATAKGLNWETANGFSQTVDGMQTFFMDQEREASVAVNGGVLKLEYGEFQNWETREPDHVQWVVSNGTIASVTSNGLEASVTGKSTGTVEVTAKVFWNAKNGYKAEQEERKLTVYVSNPKLRESRKGIACGQSGNIQVLQGSSISSRRMMYAISNENIGSIYNESVYGWSKGSCTAYVFVDGKILSCNIKFTNPVINSKCWVQKGKKISYKVKGASGWTPITYKVGNTKYAAISKSGVLKGKKYGKTTVKISVDHAFDSFYVYICKKNTVKALNKAQSIYHSKPKYSQSKRMKNGYVDCSSFVWKSYKIGNVTFGSKYYAPTAADIAKWCSKKKKTLKLSSYNEKSKKLKPGDLIFYKKRSGKNGRYKNIDHVAIYVGNDMVLHADGSSVSYSYPWYRKVAAIARPVK